MRPDFKFEARWGWWLVVLVVCALVVSVLVMLGARVIPFVSPLAVDSPLDALSKTPTPAPTASAPGNLLVNPSFEGGFVGCGQSCSVAAGWSAWSDDCEPPRCRPGEAGCYRCPSNCEQNASGVCRARDPGCWCAKAEHAAADWRWNRVTSGESSQKAFVYGRPNSGFGIRQRVCRVIPGSMILASINAQAWQCWRGSGLCNDGLSHNQENMNLQVGIDPLGGVDPWAETVVWSGAVESFDVWTRLEVSAQARATCVTFFAKARPEWDFVKEHNDVYWDDAALAAISSATATHAPSPTWTPGPILTGTYPVGLPVVFCNYRYVQPTATPWPTALPGEYPRVRFDPPELSLAVDEMKRVTVWLDGIGPWALQAVELRWLYNENLLEIGDFSSGPLLQCDREYEAGVRNSMAFYDCESRGSKGAGPVFSFAVRGRSPGTVLVEPIGCLRMFPEGACASLFAGLENGGFLSLMGEALEVEVGSRK